MKKVLVELNEREVKVLKRVLNEKIVSNWHFLPELPDRFVEVLIAYKYNKKPIQGYWNGKKWIGSFETRDHMRDGYNVRDEELIVPEDIYAWTELPDCPEIPTQS